MSQPTAGVLAVIPARGGSKGLPGKNLRPLAGLPLIAHSVKFAALCPEIARAIVSTDSAEIAAAARAAGGEVPFLRPSELASDDTPMWPVVRHALEQAEREGARYDTLLLVDPTTPCRLPADLSAALAALSDHPEADGVVAVSQPEFNPLWNLWTIDGGFLEPVFPDSGKYARRQDVPPVYRVNASLYLWRAAFVRGQPASWRDGRLLPLELPDYRCIHIDDIHEFERAELLIGAGYVKLPWLENR